MGQEGRHRYGELFSEPEGQGFAVGRFTIKGDIVPQQWRGFGSPLLFESAGQGHCLPKLKGLVVISAYRGKALRLVAVGLFDNPSPAVELTMGGLRMGSDISVP